MRIKDKTYSIITVGCQMNKSDSERIAYYLDNLGYKLSDNKYQADFIFLNTCGIRQSAENKIYSIINNIKIKNSNAKIILTGCLVNRIDVQKKIKDKIDIWLPISNILDIENLILEKNKKIVKADNCSYLKLKPKHSSKFSAFVPIGNGCNNFCFFFVVPYARGREKYRSIDKIIKEVKNLVKNGYKEIILIAQNVNSYQFKNKNFVDLLKMVSSISGNFWIRFFTSHPKDMSDELIKIIYKSEKICEHIHLPVQAGNDDILKAMNRKYNIKHYKTLIKKIKKYMPNASITTDIIVGFPYETKKQFNNTIKLFKEIKFDMAYISKYSSRPGTVAEKLKDNVSQEEKKLREKKLINILNKTVFENNKKYLNKTVQVLIEGKNKNGELYGKTKTNKNIRIKYNELKSEDLIGKFVKVKIICMRDFVLIGEF